MGLVCLRRFSPTHFLSVANTSGKAGLQQLVPPLHAHNPNKREVQNRGILYHLSPFLPFRLHLSHVGMAGNKRLTPSPSLTISTFLLPCISLVHHRLSVQTGPAIVNILKSHSPWTPQGLWLFAVLLCVLIPYLPKF
jgi:hypothetical protein